MRRTLATLMFFGVSATVSAQLPPGMMPGGPRGPGGMSRPTFSPYLNLLGRGNPAVNYFGIVRPQQQLQGLFSNLQSGIAGPGQGEDLTDPELRRGTGHIVTFDNLSHYYFNNPGVPLQQRGGMVGAMGGLGRGSFGGAMGPMSLGGRSMTGGGFARPATSFGGVGGSGRIR